MQTQKIYLIFNHSRAMDYGIGTSKIQLSDCLKRAGANFGIIELNAAVEKVTVDKKDGYEHISIPFKPHSGSSKLTEYYLRNAAYILRELIPENAKYKLLFHLNFMPDPALVQNLKTLFECKVLLTVRYTNWSFEFLGDTDKLDKVMITKRRELSKREQGVRKNFEADIKMAMQCDHVVYISRHSADTLSKYITTKNRSIICNGLKDEYTCRQEESKQDIKSKHQIGHDTKIVVFAGRLDEVKGVKYLVRSFRKVLVDHPDTRLIVAGDGDFSSLFKEAEDIWSKIIFTGRVDKKKLYELYSIADIGVVSSLHEEFGYVVIEMMMHELPVIVSDTGGPAEIVENGVSGFKIPVTIQDGQRELDTELLTSKINLLLADPNLAVTLGQNARERFLERYELSVLYEKMTSLYNSL